MNFPKSTYNKFGWLPMALIEDAINLNYLDSLCYFMWIRSSFKKKPIFYNYTLRSVAGELSCSPTTAGYHIAILKQKGLLYTHNKNLCCIGRKKLIKHYPKLMVPVGIDTNKQNQITLLRFAAIKKNLKSQVVKHSEKSEVLKFRRGEIKEYNRVKSMIKLSLEYPSTKQIENSKQDVITLGNKKFGFICNRSQSTGIKIQKKLNKLLLILSKKRLRRLIDVKVNRPYFFSLDLNSSCFLSNKGYATKRLSNELVLL